MISLVKIFSAAVLLCIFCAPQLYAQKELKRTISGTVYDEANGEALINASVYVKDLNLGSSTNLNGYFAITNVPDREVTLIISYMGYKTAQKTIPRESKESKYLTIYLKPTQIQKNEVFITADSVRVIDKLYNKPVSKVELNSAQIKAIPRVVEADLLRSLQTLPGILPLSDFSSALYVRGGTPDQNLFIMDGTDVYNPEHAFGIFSTFNTDAIKKVEVSKGGFGAEYGGRLSSVMNVTNIDGNRNNFEGKATLSLLSLSATLQMPLGSFGSVSGSLRRTYIDQTLAKIVKEVPDYYFYDGNLKAYIDLGEADKLVVSYYGGRDNLDFKFDKESDESLGFKYDWGNQTGSINWRRFITPELYSNLWFTVSSFSSNFSFDEMEILEKNKISDISVKTALEYFSSQELNLRFGAEIKFLYGSLIQNFPSARVDAAKYRNHYIGYLIANYKPSDDFSVEGGIRYDYFRSERNFQSLDPRLAIKYRLTETSSFKLAAGIYHQYLNRVPRMFFVSIWSSADEFTKESSSKHIILGFQKEIGAVYEFETEIYYKTYQDIYQYNQNLFSDVRPDRYDENNKPVFTSSKGLFNRGDGDSYGLELLLRKDVGTFTGWIGYSLARTYFNFDGINKGNDFIPRHDRTSTVNAVLNIDIKNLLNELQDRPTEIYKSNWNLGLNFVYTTGQPITLPGSFYVTNNLPDWQNPQRIVNLYPTAINEFRLPPYMRLDLSLSYKKEYDGWTLEPFLQIFNVFNRKNTWFIDYKIENKYGITTINKNTVGMFPILPSIGVNIKF